MHNEVDEAWLAGFIEGEGWFGVHKVGNHLYPCFRVESIDQDVIVRAAKLCSDPPRNVNSHALRSGKTAYWIGASGRTAVPLARRMHSLLGERRKAQIDVMMTRCDPTGIKYPEESSR